MTVAELRTKLADLPDNMAVVVQDDSDGWAGPYLCEPDCQVDSVWWELCWPPSMGARFGRSYRSKNAYPETKEEVFVLR